MEPTNTVDNWKQMGPNDAFFLDLETHEAGDPSDMVFLFYAFSQHILCDYWCPHMSAASAPNVS